MQDHVTILVVHVYVILKYVIVLTICLKCTLNSTQPIIPYWNCELTSVGLQLITELSRSSYVQLSEMELPHQMLVIIVIPFPIS